MADLSTNSMLNAYSKSDPDPDNPDVVDSKWYTITVNPSSPEIKKLSWTLGAESNEYFNYNTLAFDYKITYPEGFTTGNNFVGIVCSQQQDGKDRRIQNVKEGSGEGTISFDLKSLDGSSALVMGFISIGDTYATDDVITMSIGNFRCSWMYDWTVFTGDASLSLIGDGCAVAYIALQYCGSLPGDCGEWVYVGQGNKVQIYKDPTTDTYAIVDFDMACGASPPHTYTAVSSINMEPAGEVPIPTGCSRSFCFPPDEVMGQVYSGCLDYEAYYIDGNLHYRCLQTGYKICPVGKNITECFDYPPNSFTELGTPEYIGPVIKTTVDYTIDGRTKTEQCGTCYTVQNGTPWSLPDGCIQKDSEGKNNIVNSDYPSEPSPDALPSVGIFAAYPNEVSS